VTVLDRSRRSDALWHALAKLDDDPSVRPDAHAFIIDEAPWFTVTDDLPQYLRRASRAEPSSRSLTGLSDRLLVVQ
jgi:hypothetical protein